MKKQLTIIGIVLVALLAGGGIFIARDSLWPPQTDTTTQVTTPSGNQADTTPGPSTADPTDIRYTAEAGISSLAQLKQEAKDVVTVESSYGEYVDAIGTHKGGTDGNYWSFYVDGSLSEVGAGSYIQKGGEVIEWKFQKL